MRILTEESIKKLSDGSLRLYYLKAKNKYFAGKARDTWSWHQELAAHKLYAIAGNETRRRQALKQPIGGQLGTM